MTPSAKETAEVQLLLGVAAYRCGDLEQAAAALGRAAAHGTTAAQAQPWLSALRSEAGKGSQGGQSEARPSGLTARQACRFCAALRIRVNRRKDPEFRRHTQ